MAQTGVEMAKVYVCAMCALRERACVIACVCVCRAPSSVCVCMRVRMNEEMKLGTRQAAWLRPLAIKQW
eukprot:6353933-Amphidinium_carterae.3